MKVGAALVIVPGGYQASRIGKALCRGAGPEPAEAGSPETEPTAGVRAGEIVELRYPRGATVR